MDKCSIFLESKFGNNELGQILTTTYLPKSNILLAADGNTNVTGWNIESQEIVCQLEGVSQGFPYSLAVTSDEQFMLVGDNEGNINIWNFKEKEQVGEPIETEVGEIKYIQFTPDESSFIVSGGSQIAIYNLKSREETYTFEECSQSYGPIFLHKGGNILIYTIHNNAFVFDLQSKQVVKSLVDGHETRIASLSLTSDEKYIITSDLGQDIAIWDFENGAIVKKIEGAHAGENSGDDILSTVDASGKVIVSVGPDLYVKIWSIPDGEKVRKFQTGQEDPFIGVHLTQNQKSIISVEMSGLISTWPLE